MPLIRPTESPRRGFEIDRRGVLIGAASAAAFGGTAAARPRRGGRLRVGLGSGSTSDSLDPARFSSDFSYALSFAMNGFLVEIGPGGALRPELAESWEASTDAKTWAFYLRRGVEFHDGRSVTAADVVASLRYHSAEETRSSAKAILKSVRALRAEGDGVVIVELDEGLADLPHLLAFPALAVLPADGSSGLDWRAGVGAGGYRLVEHEPGVVARLTRSGSYWKSDRGWFDEVELLAIADPATRVAALKAGDVDVIGPAPPAEAARLDGGATRVASVASARHYTYPMHSNKAPFDDVRVRLALKHAIDRDAFVEGVLFGHGEVGADHPIGRPNPYFDASLAPPAYDPDRARALLAEAGRSGLAVSLSASPAVYPRAIEGAEIFREKAAAAGVEIQVVREPSDGYWAAVWLKKPFCAVSWNGRPTEDVIFSLAYAADAVWNESFWRNARFDRLLKEARAAIEPARRREMYHEMQRLVRDDGGSIIPAFPNHVFAMSRRVAHGELAGDRSLDGLRFAERWWFA